MESIRSSIHAFGAYEVYLAFEESPIPEVNTKWIVIVHSLSRQSCKWYTTGSLPLLNGYFKHEMQVMEKSHTLCDYGINKARIGMIGESEFLLFEALFEATEPGKSRQSVVAWLGKCVEEGLLDGRVLKRVMKELEMLR
ncbi:hypothetical protein BJX61DRAFT_547287 [Aspergillus egyptiacus]|nr:hypothetical protein BJX61DRAFT_547287 [Aspergillus egyptiacus]